MPKGGSKKGRVFERAFCRDLSLWFSKGKDDDLFWRTSNSGGRATSRRKKGKKTRNHYGDICATSKEGEPLLQLVTFELKRGYNRHTLQDMIDGLNGKCLYSDWIKQARQSAEDAGSEFWAVVVRRDRRGPLIILPREATDRFDCHDGIALSFWEHPNQLPIDIMRLSTFFDTARIKEK